MPNFMRCGASPNTVPRDRPMRQHSVCALPSSSLVWTLTALVLAPALGASAQDSIQTRLEPVRVTVTRESARSTLDLPFAISRLAIDSARTGIRRASLTEMLLAVPGLAISNRFNPSQDPRLAVRGFGARSAFGIRGVRVVRDGVPLTVADGQTAVDFVDLETVGAAEVMRGAAGALYGNASGGVVELRSDPFPAEGYRARARGVWNEDATRWSAHAAGGEGSIGWQGTFTHNSGDGPREYARFRNSAFTGDAAWRGDAGTLRAQLIWYDAPLAENPGAVTARELAATPVVADSQNIRRGARKEVGQRLLSIMGDRQWGGGSASATVFGGLRDLSNPQAFAIVGFARRTMGATARMQHGGLWRRHLWRLSFGADLQGQRDDRENFENCTGLVGAARPIARCPTASDTGGRTLHQLEKVASAGLFARGEMTRAWATLTATLRGDRTDFSVLDRRTVGTGSGTRSSIDMAAVTPMVGLTLRPRRSLSVFANYASSFETPTTTELATQPDGSPGLNPALKPQRGRTVEVGAKGSVGGRLLVDVSLFDIATRDELIPFEVPLSGGRRYFRNAGETSRRGAELGVTAALGMVDLGGSLAHLVYAYEDYLVGTTRLDGKRVPGVAPTTSSLWATARPRLGFATVEMQQGERTAADDANTVYAPGWVLWNIRAGLARWSAFGIEPVIGVDNVFDRTYSANVVSNATRGRYFEPGAGRRVYVAVTVGGARTPTRTSAPGRDR